MLLVDKKEVQLKKRYQKILNLSPALDDTFVFLGIAGFRQDCLTHVDRNGQVIAEIIFQKNMDSFGMLSDRQVMVLETRNNRILVWDLTNHERIQIPFNFKTEQTDQSFIHIFPQTKTVCIQENGRYNNNTFRLSYFNMPLTKESQPFHQFDSEEVWTYQYMVRKANNHSMIIWFKGRHDDGFQIHSYDMRQFPQGKHQVHKCPNTIGGPTQAKCEVAITTAWEMRPNELMLVCISNRTSQTEGVSANNNYVWDLKAGTIREAHFNFGKFQDLHLDQHNFGNTSMFRSFDFENGQPLPTPVYYINNETEKIIATEQWKCSYLYKYDFPAYDGNMIAEGQYENGNVEWFTLSTKKIMDPMEISVHFLNEIIEDCDEDILYGVTRMIDYGK